MDVEARIAVLDAMSSLQKAVERLDVAYMSAEIYSWSGVTIDRIRTISRRHAKELAKVYRKEKAHSRE